MKRLLLFVSALCMPMICSAAPPLADHIPGDAMAYVGWAGVNNVGSAYGESHLKSILDDSGIPKLVDEVLPAVIEKIAKTDPEARETIPKVISVTAPMWRHPTAFYFGGIDQNGGPPLPKIALICDAGSDANGMVESLRKTVDQLESPIPLTVKAYGTLVVLAIGEAETVNGMFAKPPSDSLAKSAIFNATLSEVDGATDAVLVGYLDVQAVVKHVDELIQQSSDEKAIDLWPKIRDGLGLPEIHQVLICTGFDQKDWSSQMFAGTTGATDGLAALFSPQPLSEDLLAVVPKTTDRMIALQLNLGALFREIRQGVEKFAPETTDDIEGTISRVNTLLGMDIQKDLLDSMGREWVAYTDNSISGPGLLGTVIVNKLQNPQRAEVALSQMAERANAGLRKVIEEKSVTVAFREKEINGVKLHYLAIPMISPGWSISGDKLYFGLYPETILAAIKHGSNRNNSVLASEKYQAVLKRLGGHQPSAVTYLDLPQTGHEGYSELLAASQLYVGFIDVFGIDTPTPLLPPMTTVMENLSPCGGISWSDKMGYHSKMVVPFPGAEVFSGGSVGSTLMIGEAALTTSVLLPSLNRSREMANRIKCASNLRQVGQGMLLYANENKGNYPPDLGTLIKTEDMTAQTFVCPSGRTSVPANLPQMTKDQISAWVNDNADYVYLGKGLNNTTPAEKVIVYEKEGSHEGDGTNLLFGDGHVEYMRWADAKKLIDQQASKGRGL